VPKKPPARSYEFANLLDNFSRRYRMDLDAS